MPALSSADRNPIKLLLIGDSSAGKTGALASLAAAGYNLRILDLDNGLDILKSVLTDPKSPYPKDAVERVQYRTLTETMRVAGGKILPARASVWPEMIKMLDRWKEPEADGGADLGKITDWTSQEVIVLDGITKASEAALNFIRGMNGNLGKDTMDFRDIGSSQALIANLLSLLTDRSIKANVIVICHISYEDDKNAPRIDGEGPPRVGFPSSVGKALNPLIPRWFNSMLLAKTEGQGSGTRHMLYTKPMGVVGAKSSAPHSTPNSYPLATGLADYFKAVRQGAIALPPLALPPA